MAFFACTRENVAATRDEARRRPTAYEHLMTDLPNSKADEAADAPTPDGDTPAGDPELAALVRRGAPTDDADSSLATLVAPVAADGAAAGSPTDTPRFFRYRSASSRAWR